MSGKLLLISGASGCVATHIIQQALEAGYKVRGTVRNPKDPKKSEPLFKLHPKAKQNLELVEAELRDSKSWVKAVKGVDFICHVATALVTDGANTEEAYIGPALEGTLNVLKAASQEKSVKKVVVCSSLSAHTEEGENKGVISESNWVMPADLSDILVYNRSKVIAERAAWAFYEALPSKTRFELCTVSPTWILGPVLYASTNISNTMIIHSLEGAMPFAMPITIPIVDVRDVARAHLTCLTTPEASGRRHIAWGGNLTSLEVNKILKEEFGPQGYEVTTNECDKDTWNKMCDAQPTFGVARAQFSWPIRIDNSRLKEKLKINPINPKQTVIDTAYSLIEFGLIKKTSGYKGRPGAKS